MRIVFAAMLAAAVCGQAEAAYFVGQDIDPSPSVLFDPAAAAFQRQQYLYHQQQMQQRQQLQFQPYQGGPPAGWIPSPGQQPPPGWVPPAGWVPSAPQQRTIFCQRVDTNLVSCW